MAPLRRVRLTELNAHLVCVLCSGYFIDATTIIECLHTFCKTCIVRYLQTSSFCPICDVQVHKTKPLLSLREDRTLQDVVFKLVPGLFHSEMKRRFTFYTEHPEAGGDKTEQSLRERRHFFHVDDQISLSLEYLPAPPSPTHPPHLHPLLLKPLKASNGQQDKQQKQGGGGKEEEGGAKGKGEAKKEEDDDESAEPMVLKRFLRCPAAVQVSHLEKFIRLKYGLSPPTHRVDIMHGGDCLMGELTLLDVVYMYKWAEDSPLRLFYTVTAIAQSRKRPRLNGTRALVIDREAPAAKIPRLQEPQPQEASKTQEPSCEPKDQEVSIAPSVASPQKKLTEPEDQKEEKMDTCDSVADATTDSNELSAPPAKSDAPVPSTPAPTTSTVSTTVGNTATSTKNSVVNLYPAATPTIARSALTTTTPATTTPRVALTKLPSSVTPNVSVTVSAIESTVPVTAVDAKGTLSNSIQAKTGNVVPVGPRMPMPPPAVNGLSSSGTQTVMNPMAYANKRPPQPIIPSRPRLGRPPNSSRMNNNMRPPAPRLGDMRNPRPVGPPGKKFPPGVIARGNQMVSASLNVQSRLSSISGPPASLGSAKLSVKRPHDAGKDGTVNDSSEQAVKSAQTQATTPGVTMVAQSIQTSHSALKPTYTSSTNSQSVTATTATTRSITSVTHKGTQCMDQAAVNHTHQPQGPQNGNQHSNSAHQHPAVSQRPVTQGVHHPPNAPSAQHDVSPRPPTTNPQNLSASGVQANPRPPCPQKSPSQQNSNAQSNQGNRQHSGSQSAFKTSDPRAPAPVSRPMAGPQSSPVNHPPQRCATPSMSQAAPHPPTRPSGTAAPYRPMSSPAPHRLAGSPAPQRPPSNPVPQRPSSTPSPQRPSSNPGPQRPSSNPAPQRPYSSPSPAPQKPSIPSPAQEKPNSSPAPHRPPSSPAPHRSPSNPAPQRPPSSPAPHRSPSNPAPQRPPSIPAPHRPVNGPMPQRPQQPPQQRPTGSPAPQRPMGSPAPQRPSSSPSPAPHRPSMSPAPHRFPGSPAPHRPPSSQAPHRPSASPAPHRPSASPTSHRPPSSPAPHRVPSSPAPHRAGSTPSPHRPPGSPAPHRQVTVTSQTQTPPSSSVAKSTPSPSISTASSAPSISTASSAPNPKEKPTPVSSATVGTNKSISTANKQTGPREVGAPVAPRVGMSPNTQSAKVQSPSSNISPGVKVPPKSPGRARSTSGSSPTILSIAQSLASRQLQQLTTSTSSTVNSSTNTTITQMGTQPIFATTTDAPMYPPSVVNSLVNPAALAAYLSTYTDPTTALTDVAAMRNLITLSQTAACIREINLAVVKAAEMPRTTDPAPMDLSPTSKAAPHTPLTNGRSHSSSPSTTSTKITNSLSSKSPSKVSRSEASAGPTISPPTPEVTITKLPNSVGPASSSTVTSGTTKSTFGSSKLGSTNTNTVSITKRPASSNRIAVAKSPSNASVRQIPNPSILSRQKSETRNNNNVAKTHSASATTNSNLHMTNNSSGKSHSTNKQSSNSGRPTGNSPLKETGPLPETSSILKIEHLTRSLPAPAAAASHGLRFLDDR